MGNGGWSRNLSQSRGPAAGQELHHGSPVLPGPEKGTRMTYTRSQGQKLSSPPKRRVLSNLFTECFIVKGTTPLKQSNLSMSNPKYLLGRVSVQTHHSDLFPSVLPSLDKSWVPGQDKRPKSLTQLPTLCL